MAYTQSQTQTGGTPQANVPSVNTGTPIQNMSQATAAYSQFSSIYDYTSRLGDQLNYLNGAVGEQQNMSGKAMIDSYNQMYDSPLVGGQSPRQLNEKLVDMTKMMNGTRNDILNEIQSSGTGMTASQLENMVSVRNRNLQLQYNNVLQQQQLSSSMLNEYMSLTNMDWEHAQTKFTNITNLQNQKTQVVQAMWSAARDQVNQVIEKIGYTGLSQMVTDPNERRSLEPLLGLPSGFLDKAPLTLTQQDMAMREQQIAISQQEVALKQKEVGISAANLGVNQQYLQLARQTQYSELANRIITSPANAPYTSAITAYAGARQPFQRLMSAVERAKENGGRFREQDFREVLDSSTQIQTAGNQITQGQIFLSSGAQSYASQLSTVAQRISGEGGEISQSNARQLIDLSGKLYKEYVGSYQEATGGLKEQLSNVNGVNLNHYLPIGDFSKVDQLSAQLGQQQNPVTLTPKTGVGSVVTDPSSGIPYTVQGFNPDGSAILKVSGSTSQMK